MKPEKDAETRKFVTGLAQQFAATVYSYISGQNKANKAATPESSETSLFGIPLSSFKNTPYWEVSRGRLLDGPNGPVVAKDILNASFRKFFARNHDQPMVHGVELVALQAKTDLPSWEKWKTRARTSMINFGNAIIATGRALKKSSRRGLVWYAEQLIPSPVELSVEGAKALAEQAEKELDGGHAQAALCTAFRAVKLDAGVQLAHEVACCAAVKLDCADDSTSKQISRSIAFLLDVSKWHSRIIQAGRQCSECENHDEPLAQTADLVDRSVAEKKRLEEILERASERFGNPQEDPPVDRPANMSLKMARELRLTADGLLLNPLAEPILAHTNAARLRKAVEIEARMRKVNDETDVCRAVNFHIARKALDVRIAPRIRLIISHAMYAVRGELGLLGKKIPIEKAAAELENTRMTFYAVNGRYPSEEEEAKLTGRSMSEIEDIRAWMRIVHPILLDSGEHRRKGTKKSSDDDEEDDNAIDELTLGMEEPDED